MRNKDIFLELNNIIKRILLR